MKERKWVNSGADELKKNWLGSIPYRIWWQHIAGLLVKTQGGEIPPLNLPPRMSRNSTCRSVPDRSRMPVAKSQPGLAAYPVFPEVMSRKSLPNVELLV